MALQCHQAPGPMARRGTSLLGCPPAPATLPISLLPASLHLKSHTCTLEINDSFLYCPCLSLKVTVLRSKGPSIVAHCASSPGRWYLRRVYVGCLLLFLLL